MTTFDEIISATKSALDRRDSRRDLLADKIETLAKSAMEAARVARLDLGASLRIEFCEVTASCSQWADGSRARARVESHYLLVGTGDPCWLTEHDLSFFDGHNTQHQRGPAESEYGTIRRATVAQLRVAARMLPEAIAKLLSETQADAEEQTADADEALSSMEVAS